MKKIITFILLFVLTFSLTGCKSGEVKIPESDEGDANYAIINIRGFGEITVELKPEFAPNTYERFVENVKSGFYTGKNFHRIIKDFMIQGGSFSGTGVPDPNAEGVKTEIHPDARHYYGALCLAANAHGEGSDSFYIVNNKDTQAVEKTKESAEYRLLSAQYELEDIKENMDVFIEMYGEDFAGFYIEQVEGTIDRFERSLEYIENMSAEIRSKYQEVGGAPSLDNDYTVFGYTVSGFDVIDKISAAAVVDNGAGEPSKPVEEIIIEWVVVKTNLE